MNRDKTLIKDKEPSQLIDNNLSFLLVELDLLSNNYYSSVGTLSQETLEIECYDNRVVGEMKNMCLNS